jgi:hypothetical protein
MPPSKYKKPEFTLSTADQHNMLVKLKCGLCRQVHLYYSRDVITLIGDVPLWDIARAFRCEKCKTGEYLRADWHHLYSPDIGKTTVRRLVRIKRVDIPIWTDEVI